MKYILTIDNPDKHTVALINLIKATDNVFLKEETKAFKLTAAHKAILDEQDERHLGGKGKSYTWQEVKRRARTRAKTAK